MYSPSFYFNTKLRTPGDDEEQNMMSFSPWGSEESDTSKWLKKRHAHPCIGQQFGQLFQKGFENFPLALSKQVWRALIYHFPIKTITNSILVYLHLFISSFQLHEEDTIFLLFCRKKKMRIKDLNILTKVSQSAVDRKSTEIEVNLIPTLYSLLLLFNH